MPRRFGPFISALDLPEGAIYRVLADGVGEGGPRTSSWFRNRVSLVPPACMQVPTEVHDKLEGGVGVQVVPSRREIYHAKKSGHPQVSILTYSFRTSAIRLFVTPYLDSVSANVRIINNILSTPFLLQRSGR